MTTNFNLIRSRLLQERDRLTKELQRLEAGNRPAGDRGGSWFGNRDEQANEATELRNQQSSKRHLTDSLREIEHALRKIDAGTYGSCDNCGQPIEPARLEALPQATTCLKCKALRGRQNR